MKNKFNDNRLAEPSDCIVLKKSTTNLQVPKGSVGVLTKDYTGRGREMQGYFFGKDGKGYFISLHLNDFRVLNEDKMKDIRTFLSAYDKCKNAELPTEK